jgi:hypothetical protein
MCARLPPIHQQKQAAQRASQLAFGSSHPLHIDCVLELLAHTNISHDEGCF